MVENFVNFHEALLDLLKTFEQKNVLLRVQSDLDSNTIKIYGEGSGALERAKGGLEEVAELAYATAEHHKYWNLMYNGSQILKIVLEKWNETLTKEELEEIVWYTDEIKNSLGKLSTTHYNE
jgi:hypothetical protein